MYWFVSLLDVAWWLWNGEMRNKCGEVALAARGVQNWTKKNQSRIVSISPTSDDDTVEKAQKLNHDISVDLSAEAINYHQMVCPRHRETSSNQMALAQIILKKNFRRWCCLRVVSGGAVWCKPRIMSFELWNYKQTFNFAIYRRQSR